MVFRVDTLLEKKLKVILHIRFYNGKRFLHDGLSEQFHTFQKKEIKFQTPHQLLSNVATLTMPTCYLVSIHINCVIDNNPRTYLDAVGRAGKASQGVWVLSCDADHNRPRPAAV